MTQADLMVAILKNAVDVAEHELSIGTLRRRVPRLGERETWEAEQGQWLVDATIALCHRMIARLAGEVPTTPQPPMPGREYTHVGPGEVRMITFGPETIARPVTLRAGETIIDRRGTAELAEMLKAHREEGT